jgi:hypothetical protein
MKRITIAACLLCLLCSAVCASAQENRLDISLEGPWILYVDRSLAQWPVLIAVAPAPDLNDPWQHGPVHVSSGDGYFLGNGSIQQGVYCLTFDGICAPQGARSLLFHDYPDYVQLLQVNSPSGPGVWNWIDASQKSGPTFVLPVPDSYSSDGAWPIRFSGGLGGKFDATGQTYSMSEQHSIGVQLHYKTGPSNFDLSICGFKPVSHTPIIGDCSTPATPSSGHTHLSNSGTLRIEMKAPETTWACDPHVRHIYPRMLDLIDINRTVNSKIVFIDPAHGVDANGLGVFDSDDPSAPPPNGPITSDRCLVHDHQGGYDDTYPYLLPIVATGAQGHNMQNATERPWFDQLQDLLTAASRLESSDQRAYYFDKIRDASKDLSFPRISQVEQIETFIALSNRKLEQKLHSKCGDAGSKGTQERTSTLQTTMALECALLADPPTKNGSDCKAPVVLVK